MLRTLSLFATTFLFLPALLAGGPVTWTFEAVTGADGKVQVLLKATCEEGWHIYALTLPRDDGPIPTAVRLSTSESYEAGAVLEQTPEAAYDPNFEMDLRFHSDTSVFTVPVQRLKEGPITITGEVEYMACNDKTCLPPKVVTFSVTVPVP